MEMALRPQSPLCCRGEAPRSRPELVVRPAARVLAQSQSIVRCKRFTRSKFVRCIVASSDYPKRKPKRSVLPKNKVSAPRGFDLLPQVELGSRKTQQSNVDDGITPSTNNNAPGRKETETTSTTEEQTDEVVLSASGSSSTTQGGMDVVDDSEADEKADQKTSPALSSVSTDNEAIDRKLAEYRGKIGALVSSKPGPLSIASVHDKGRSIVSLHEQDRSIVSVREQAQSKKGQTKQTAIDREQDVPKINQVREATAVEAEEVGSGGMVGRVLDADGDGVPQNIGGSDLHVKFDMHNLSQRQNVDDTQGAAEKMVSEKLSEEELPVAEEEAGKIADKEQPVVAEEEIAASEDEARSIVDEKQPVVAEEELAEAGDEAGTIADEQQPVVIEEELVGAEYEMEMTDAEEHGEVDETILAAEPDIQEPPQEPVHVDLQAIRRRLQELAKENSATGNKFFVFPEVVKADTVIDLYLNRSLSTLASEPDVLIKGAFNGWRWKFFTERLHKCELGGDWWSCRLYIPKQAYRVDFVFFNGGTVYDNNDSNDFFLNVESTMSELSFEDFLIEEKRKELEKLAAEEAERRRQAEEQRQREEERAASEADRAQAKAEVQMKKDKLRNTLSLARTHVDNLWYIEPNTYRGGDRVRLYYNRSSRPLMHNTEIWMHGGYNNWIDGLCISERVVRSDKNDGDWWVADVVVPERALVLDWVFADGPPGNARNYDNNGRQDFHAIVPNSMSEELYWVEEEHRIYRRLQQERKEREEVGRRKAERTAKIRAEMKEKTMRMFVLSQKHIVYTEPLEVRAGTTINVLYNPSNTVLNGKPEVWFRCSFNRWTHPKGPLPPQKMVKTENGSHLKATVRVPLDAYMIDFVFSESEDGGIYDNRMGMDYHIPVSGAVAKEPPMHIVHVAVEMAPIAKVGGLGDVVTSLSRAVQELGHNVEVILPKYDCINMSNVKDLHFRQSFTSGGTEIKVWFGRVESLPVYFLEPQNGMFWVGCVYGRNDDSRFGFFCHSALEFLLQSGSSPDIIHCHDWSSAPVAWLFKEHYAHYGLANARVIFTIHNLEFGVHHISRAMAHCDKATTVSYTYSREVAGHSAIAPHHFKFHGIRNGIDPDIWDPYNDIFIPVHYTSENVVEGKRAAKQALQAKLGLQRTDDPILGIITRLTIQKGIHLIKHAIWRTLERNGQVVLLGSAPDPRIQNEFVNLADQLHGVYHGRVKLCLTYDEPLSHLIYAGSDFILVPSLFEPCGLTQLTAMRYGSIPIVRKTGGLYDTVFDVDNDKDRARAQGLEPNGFSFEGADINGVDYALNRAISAWYDGREWIHSLCKRVMEQDWSWNRPALDYIELYHSARKF